MKKEILRTLIKEAVEESRLDKTKNWVKENPGKIGAGVGIAAGAGLGLAGAKKLNQFSTKRHQPYFNYLNRMKETAEDVGKKLGDYELRDKIQDDMKEMIKKRKKENLMNSLVFGAEGAAIGGLGGALVGDAYQKRQKEKTSAIDLKQNNAGEYGLSRFYKPKQTAKKYGPSAMGAGLGGFAANKLTKDKKNKKRNTMLGALGGGTVGELARRIKTSSYSNEPEPGVEYKKFGLTDEDVRSMSREFEKYRQPWEIEEARKRSKRMKKYMNAMGDGSPLEQAKTMSLQKMDQLKDNKKAVAATLGAGAAGYGLGRLSKKASNLAELNQRNETVATSFSPRRDKEMTEKLKRLIREYENDRG